MEKHVTALFQNLTLNPVTPVVKGISGCASPTRLLSNETIPPKERQKKNPCSKQILELIEEAGFDE